MPGRYLVHQMDAVARDMTLTYVVSCGVVDHLQIRNTIEGPEILVQGCGAVRGIADSSTSFLAKSRDTGGVQH